MPKTLHLTDDDLILFMDREMDSETAAIAEQHLFQCLECGKRLRSFQNGSVAYTEYRQRVLEPVLQVPRNG